MQNIEIKAKYENLAEAQKIALNIGAVFESELHQVDTYFNVKNGRLKMREINSQEVQLIYYERPDTVEAKWSYYQIYPVQDTLLLKEMLESALNTWCVVEKRRKVYWYENVRIHLDDVKQLDTYLELEGVIENESQKSKTRDTVMWLMAQFNIAKCDLVDRSYSDLIESKLSPKNP